MKDISLRYVPVLLGSVCVTATCLLFFSVPMLIVSFVAVMGLFAYLSECLSYRDLHDRHLELINIMRKSNEYWDKEFRDNMEWLLSRVKEQEKKN